MSFHAIPATDCEFRCTDGAGDSPAGPCSSQTPSSGRGAGSRWWSEVPPGHWLVPRSWPRGHPRPQSLHLSQLSMRVALLPLLPLPLGAVAGRLADQSPPERVEPGKIVAQVPTNRGAPDLGRIGGTRRTNLALQSGSYL